MTQFTDLLGSLMQAGMARSSLERAGNGMGGRAAAGSLTDLISGLGQAMAGSGGAATGTGGGLGGMLGEVLSSVGRTAGGNNNLALGGLGALAGALFGGGGKAARGAVGGGTLAMLASLAVKALQQAGRSAAPPRALFEPQTPEEVRALEDEAKTIVRAMITAAKADGSIDQAEVDRIIGKLDDDGLTAEEKEFFLTEARRPLDLNRVVASAAGSPELAAQIYAASLLAIEVDTDAERRYLEELAAGLGLDNQAVGYLTSTLGVRV